MRVRQAARLAHRRKTINQALTLGFSRVHGSLIPDNFEFFWKPPEPVYDPEQARQLLAEAGYPNGFDAGFYNCDSSYANLAEAANNYLGAVGIRAKLRPLERVVVQPAIHGQEAEATSSRAAAVRSATPRRAWRPSW